MVLSHVGRTNVVVSHFSLKTLQVIVAPSRGPLELLSGPKRSEISA